MWSSVRWILHLNLEKAFSKLYRCSSHLQTVGHAPNLDCLDFLRLSDVLKKLRKIKKWIKKNECKFLAQEICNFLQHNFLIHKMLHPVDLSLVGLWSSGHLLICWMLEMYDNTLLSNNNLSDVRDRVRHPCFLLIAFLTLDKHNECMHRVATVTFSPVNNEPHRYFIWKPTCHMDIMIISTK